MKKTLIIALMSLFSLWLISLGLTPKSSQSLAQIEENDSEEFVEPGNEETEPEIETLENEQSQESTEEREEQNLVHPILREENSPSGEIEDRPAPGVEDNMRTPPPLGETEAQFSE
ncbi:MAG: hypothetical protein AAGF26_03030 [Cyanobacteria bacterium P01_G01_bin.49]